MAQGAFAKTGLRSIDLVREWLVDKNQMHEQIKKEGLGFIAGLMPGENYVRRIFRDIKENTIRWLFRMYDPKDPDLIYAGGGYPLFGLMPKDGLKRAWDNLFKDDIKLERALQYGKTDGHTEVKKPIFQYAVPEGVRRYIETVNTNWNNQQRQAGVLEDQLTQNVDHMMLVNGSQRALDLIGRVVPGAVLTTEDIYLGFMGPRDPVVAGKVHGIKTEKDGMDMNALEQRIFDLRKAGKGLSDYYNIQIQEATVGIEKVKNEINPIYKEPVSLLADALEEFVKADPKDVLLKAKLKAVADEFSKISSPENIRKLERAIANKYHYEVELEKIQDADPKTIYIAQGNPNHRQWSAEKVRQLNKIAHKHDLQVIWDGAYDEFQFGEKKINPWDILNPEQLSRWVYLGTFSKTAVPGARLGYVISTNQDLMQKFIAVQGNTDLTPGPLSAALIAEFVSLDEGKVYKDHVANVRKAYEAQAKAFTAAFRAIWSTDELSLEIGETEVGLFYWLGLPNQSDGTKVSGDLVSMALAPKGDAGGLNTIVTPGSAFAADGDSNANYHLRINMSMNTLERLEELALRMAVGLDGIYGLGSKEKIIERWQAHRVEVEHATTVPDFVKNWVYKPTTN